jgi:ribosomal protein L7/L12/uncharacterized protein YegL
MTDKPLTFSASLDRYQLPAGQPGTDLSCQVNIRPNIASGDGGVPATTVSICLLFDCSSSMMGKKFRAAVETAKMIVDILHERHTISLIAFQSDSHIVFQNAVPSEGEKEFIKEQIDTLELHLGGGTNMAAGIESGMEVLSEGTADAEILVMLSDGEPIFIERAQLAAEVASQKGIQIFAVGIGESYNADQLLRLVTPSNGAVFGDADEEKIFEIFHELINRIDRIFATRVKLKFTFDECVRVKKVFKTSPERALYDSLKINRDDNSLELRVGNVEADKEYEFLLQLEVNSRELGTIALVAARLQYDINHLGINRQADEIILTVDCTEEDSPQAGSDENIGNALRSVTMVQLSDELVQACSRSDTGSALRAIDKLQHRCDEEDNTTLQQHLDNMKSNLIGGGTVSDKERNDFLLASTSAPPRPEPIAPPAPVPSATPAPEPIAPTAPEPVATPAPEPVATPRAEPLISAKAEIFELVLVDPGSETIRLLREIRYATSMGLREISDIMQRKDSVITAFKSRAAAEALQLRLRKVGADVEVHGRERRKEDQGVK